ncbi:hypothetical protein J1N35_029330 [Gossypium stocksii]|uniref:BED-type domain-containing protein n=1 Tax=Gossypium stocksii TaxID=47602 RepID=A0A9D3ZT14_9ROSI|nr:hypothetical protein J1N35_029330 [Gossypium stocksii]
MPPREEFPTKGLEGAPSNDIGWHFGTPVPNAKGNIVCKLCGKVVKGGTTRFKEHIAHKTGNVAPCPNVTGVIRESMMNILKESNTKKIDKKRRKDELLSQLREEEDEHEEFIDEISAIRQATRESIQSQHEEYHRERTSKSIPIESEFTLRGAIPELVRSKSSKQPKISDSFLKSFRKKIGEAVSKFLRYERLPFQLASSPWLYNLIQVSTKVGQGVKLPTPYGVPDVYLESEYQRVHDWVNGLKTHWKELGATLICDGWTNGLNQMHIINFLVYCSKGTVFWKSVDVLSVHSRDAKFYYSLLDSVVEKIGENYIVQIVTDNEAAMKAAGKKLMLKRKHLYWTSCAAHCLDLCLEDIGKRPSVAKVLDEAKKVTWFIYNHTWIVDLMKKYTLGKQILRPALTRFATHFIQLEEITRQKQGLREMFNSKIRHQKRMSIDDINASFNPISLDYIFEDVGPLSEWLHEKKNPLLDGENAGVLPVDTSDDEMDVNQSQQQNLSHSSSSSSLTPSQSGDGPDGGGLSPIDGDDRYSGDRGEIRSSSQYGGEYRVGTTSGHFRDRSEFDGNMCAKPRRDRSEPRAPSKGKGKKHTSIGSSSGRRSSSSNLGYSDSSTSTQSFYPPEQPSYFQPSHGYPQSYGYYPPFPNYGVPYQPQRHPPPPMYHSPPPFMYPPPQIYPPYQLYENQGENVTFLYIFLDKGQENQVKNALKVKVKDLIFLVIPLIGEN